MLDKLLYTKERLGYVSVEEDYISLFTPYCLIRRKNELPFKLSDETNVVVQPTKRILKALSKVHQNIDVTQENGKIIVQLGNVRSVVDTSAIRIIPPGACRCLIESWNQRLIWTIQVPLRQLLVMVHGKADQRIAIIQTEQNSYTSWCIHPAWDAAREGQNIFLAFNLGLIYDALQCLAKECDGDVEIAFAEQPASAPTKLRTHGTEFWIANLFRLIPEEQWIELHQTKRRRKKN